jgi:hypothetical protein
MKHENVPFWFVSEHEGSERTIGTVLVRGDEMVLEIDHPSDPSEVPYLIKGHQQTGAFFAGKHHGLPHHEPVFAKWAQVGDEWVGLWIEDHKEYLFSFALTPGSTNSA